MPQTITVSDEVFARMQTFAEPLVDTPDSILEKLMRMAQQPHQQRDTGQGESVRTDIVQMSQWILEYLRGRRTPATSREIHQHIQEHCYSLMTTADLESLPGGQVRWRRTAGQARRKLEKEEIIRPGSAPDTWRARPPGAPWPEDPPRSPEDGGKPTRNPEDGGEPTRVGFTPQAAYKLPILQYLHGQADGSAASHEVAGHIESTMRDRFARADLEPTPKGGPRWRRILDNARLQLARDGMLRQDSPTGVWQITDRGSERLQQANGEENHSNNRETQG